LDFGLWLIKRGNRESTVKRKLRIIKSLSGSPQDMMLQVLSKNWCDKIKAYASSTQSYRYIRIKYGGSACPSMEH